jgi:hypothetical protein
MKSLNLVVMVLKRTVVDVFCKLRAEQRLQPQALGSLS